MVGGKLGFTKWIPKQACRLETLGEKFLPSINNI